jgi:hypothetical protein
MFCHFQNKTGRHLSKQHLTLILLLFFVTAIIAGCTKTKSTEAPLGTEQKLRFVFLADSRGDTLDHMVNTPVLSAIIQNIVKLQPSPSFVLFGGDMSLRGYFNGSYTFQDWKSLFTPLADSGIPLYTALGNHELYRDTSSTLFWRENQQEFQQVFSQNPSNGPTGYEHLVYSFTEPGSSSFFAVLDPYYLSKDSAHLHLGGNIDTTQMGWLKREVARSGALHKFLLIHAPYYYVSNDPEEPSEANKTYTELWSYIDANKFDMYLCGHQHLYSRKTIDSAVIADPQTVPATAPWKNNVVQLLNGTCGADICTTTIDPTIKDAWHVSNKADTYYFSVIDIAGKTVTVTSYSGNTGVYTVFDSFTLVK